MGENFETRVWRKALDRGLVSTHQVNECLRETGSTESSTVTQVLVHKGYLNPEQLIELCGQVVAGDAEAPEEVRKAALQSKHVLGKYVIVAELGRGGMGAVYKAWDGDLRRWVAIKKLTGPWEDEDLRRFRREAQSAAALRHPNIVTIYEIGGSEDSPYIAMEFVEGETLDGRKLHSRKAAELMVRIARAVESAHRRGIVHRDLKPLNLMVDAAGQPRVMDFGLARPVVSSSQITLSGTVVGTPAYMAPEQAQGRASEVGPRSDVFSLGVCLYELLTGQTPFKGRTPLETLSAVVERAPVPPRRLAPSIPRPLEAIILTCLRKDPAKRYASAEALAGDLERFLKGAPVEARIPRSYSTAIVAASAAAAFAIVFAVLLLRPSSSPPPPAPPPQPAPPPPKAVDRSMLDRGLNLLEEARLDLYRGGVSVAATRRTLQEADACLTEALRLDPASGPGALGRGQVRVRLHRGEEALADFAAAIRLMPTSPAAYLARGRFLLERFIEEMTAASWMQSELPSEVLQWRDLARADFLKARDLGVAEGDLPYLDIFLAFAEERLDPAIDAATRGLATAAHPEEFYKLRGDVSEAKAERSAAIRERGDLLQKTLYDYTQAIRLRANYPEAIRRRGAVLWKLGKTDDALADFRRVLDMDPDDSQALSDIGTFFQRKGELPRAMEHFEKALKANPLNFRALSNRGVISMEQNRWDEARKDLEAAFRANPNHLATQFNLAICLAKQGDTAGAIRRLSEILDRAPNFGRARYSRGVFYYNSARWAEALQDLEKAAASDPSIADLARPRIEECRRRLGR